MVETQQTTGLASQRQIKTSKQLLPGEFKQSEVRHISGDNSPLERSSKAAPKAPTSEDLRTKSGIKSTAAFEQAEKIVVSSMQEQTKKETNKHFVFHPSGDDLDEGGKEESEEDNDIIQNLPAASQPPSLPVMDSEKSVKAQQRKDSFVSRAQQFSQLESALNVHE